MRSSQNEFSGYFMKHKNMAFKYFIFATLLWFYGANLQAGINRSTWLEDDTLTTLSQDRIIYKTIDTVNLALDIIYPPEMKAGQRYPAIIFFFGGGWNGGSVQQFEPHAIHFARRGMIAIRADYRVKSRHGTTPFDAVEDAKSAIRFLRANSELLQIDTSRIVASGGSAGGHLAAAAGTLKGLDNPAEDMTISSKPNALVLFNPVFDNGPGGYGYDRIGERYPYISPIHNIREGAPPTIVFLGTEDRLIPVETARTYKRKMEAAGSRCDLFLYEEQEHGFFNFPNTEYYQKTLKESDHFLVSLGYKVK
jgi:acetyl esterase